MTDYRIEKMRRFVALVLTDGQRIEGEIFLRPTAPRQTRPERPDDLLNDPSPFFPMMCDGKVRLVAKANVVVAETSNELDDEFDSPVLGIPVEATLIDGSACQGSVFLETRPDRPRLLDFLNSYDARFLPLVAVGRIILVNTHSIAHVREVD
jgi:hypothetical protein